MPPEAAARAIFQVGPAQVLQDQPDTLTVLSLTPELAYGVKVSFCEGLAIGRVGVPEISADGMVLGASLFDLLATNLKVLLGNGLSLAVGLGAARAFYGAQFPVRECLKALVSFADGDLADLQGQVAPA